MVANKEDVVLYEDILVSLNKRGKGTGFLMRLSFPLCVKEF
jgi:hypothetical protein